MLQTANVGVEEGAQVGGAVFQHRQSIEAHAPGETLVLVRIMAAHLDDLRVDHAAAQDLEPVIALPQLDLRAGTVAANVDFGGWLGEREV